jgi:hypothetical protein
MLRHLHFGIKFLELKLQSDEIHNYLNGVMRFTWNDV